MNNYPYFQGTSPTVPQQPYSTQWGYPPQQPTQSQGDFIDQATKILNFVEALQQRGAGRGTQQQQQTQEAQGQPAQYSVANFQPQTAQTIGDQERRLAQLATSTPNSSFSTQTNSAPSSQPQQQVSNNLEAALQQQVQVLAQGFQAAIAERDAAFKLVDSLVPYMQVNALLNQEIDAMDKAIASLTPFVQAAQIWMNDALAHEQVLDNVCLLMSDPDFLVYWSARVWGDRIQHNGQAALEWISDEYLNLLNSYEQKFMAANNGQHSPIWYRMQPKTINPVQGSVDSQNYQQQIPIQFQQPLQQQYAPQYQQPPQQFAPMPPIPGSNPGVGGPIEELKARVAMLKTGTPDLGQALQRMHTQGRQAMGADIYV